jgi:hypothetical protein
VAHIAEQEKLDRRYAVGMGGNPTLANIDLPIGKQFAKMIVGSPIAEAEF